MRRSINDNLTIKERGGKMLSVNKIKSLLILFFPIVMSNHVYGHSFATNATIDEIHTEIMNPGMAFFSVSTITGKPVCATHALYDYALDTTAVGGEAMLSVIVTTLASGKNVSVKGNAVCTKVSTVEDVRHIIIRE